ncbi:MAG: hypothetical protein HY290_05515 [Planctomycetia bacterium]|nr:hypothetical protein [Planctomycetia bacterium]
MSLLPVGLAIFAAFFVWLTVRIINRRERCVSHSAALMSTVSDAPAIVK